MAQVTTTIVTAAAPATLARVQADQHDLAAALGLLGCDAMPKQLSELNSARSRAEAAAGEEADVTPFEAAYKLVRQKMMQA